MTPEQTELLTLADKAAQCAYAPYSNFRVGAAVLTDKGSFTGANIENACTNLGICAERVAIAHARMHDCTTIIGIAVSCIDTGGMEGGKAKIQNIVPCGACRQWIAELAPDAWLITRGSDKIFSIKDLLPEPFSLQP